MELRHLKNFIALAEEKQFTAAARKVNIVQSGLSVSIKELEQELGTQLVNRSTRRVSLTASGVRFLEHARASLAMLDAGVEVVRTRDNHVHGLLRLGILQSLTPYINLPKRLALFRKRYPDVEFSVCNHSVSGMPTLVKAGEIDLSFCPLTGQDTWPGLTVTPFAEDEIVGVCSVRNKLAKCQEVSLEQLAHENFVDFSVDRAIRRLVDQIYATSQQHRRTLYEVSNVESLLNFVAEDLGVAIIPSQLVEVAAKCNDRLVSLRLKHLTLPSPHWRIAILLPQ